MTAVCLILGGSIFGFLGLAHACYTFSDLRRPRRIVPDDPAVLEAMSATGVRLARGGTTMWRAWIGFNFSHSLGALLFSAACLAAGVYLDALALPNAALLIPVAVGGIYLVLAVRYWFRVPLIGIALATLSFVAGWLAY
jgi:hypothetical protein